ncbi:MAG TPA: rod shape-determining protein MreD [Thermoanaerobaculia bacterium]|nr:rod shape-determining protein MreD [Thermoanaerobaculia bacterium]
MTFVKFLLALLAAYLVHLVGVSISPLFPRVVDPFLLVVVWYSMRTGPVGAELIGTATGLLQDGLSGGLFGLHAFAETVVGYGVALAAQRVVVGQQAARVLIFAAAAALQQLVLMGLLRAMVGAHAPLPSVGSVIGKIITSALLGAALISMESRARTQWSSWQRRRSRILRFR